MADGGQKVRTIRRAKLARLRDGVAPRLLDLFAGCGGMSLGFAREGFRVVGAVECDEVAALSHALNFHRHDAPADRDRHRRPRDITKLDPDALASELDLGDTPAGVDVVVGGPPCQSYARVGRAKLREVYEHPEALWLGACGRGQKR